MNTTLLRRWDFKGKVFNSTCVSEERSIERCNATAMFNRLSHLSHDHLSQNEINKIKKTFSGKNDHSRCNAILQSPLCQVRTNPTLMQKKKNMFHTFLPHIFRKFVEVNTCLSRFCSLFNSLWHSCQLESSFYKSL